MVSILIILGLFVMPFLIAWKLTNRLYRKFYNMAAKRNKADVFESIVRRREYVHPIELHAAYLEAINS